MEIHRETFLRAVRDQDAMKLSHLMVGIPEGKNKTPLANELLVQALDTGNRSILEVLLTNGADLNAPIESADFGPFQLYDLRPLEFAIIHGKIDAVSALIDMGADVDLADHDGQTPLQLACATVYFPTEGVKKLLEAGADCNKGCHQSPLQIAASCGRPGVVKLLLEHGGDVHQTDADGNTCLSLALTPQNSVSSKTFSLPSFPISIYNNATSCRIRKDRLSCAQILLDAGSDVNHYNAKGVSILQSVVKTHLVDKDLLSTLLSYGANPDAGEVRSGITPLISLVCSPLQTTPDLMTLLLEHGAAINKTEKRGNTVLHIAAASNNLKMIRFLIDNGADMYVLNDRNLSFLDKLSVQSYLNLLPSLLGKGVYPCKIFVRSGSDFESFITRCESHLPPTPLSLAVFFGDTELASYLREIGFLTGEDIRWLTGDSKVRNKLPVTAIETYNGIITGVLPLTLMSFIKISDMLGATRDRQEKIKQLRLPNFLQERLLFKRASPMAPSSRI
ncbi:hypothetical protein RRG08_003714 [Elysia crispata]|uniref:Peptidase A2 domain-containing protein n=1 Tax=Elysia crispata TaxID=231223 RepID=A0AAE1E5S2_9GAST|nr:hypothetical protein RRG08_003714 [Elysia crispata]